MGNEMELAMLDDEHYQRILVLVTMLRMVSVGDSAAFRIGKVMGGYSSSTRRNCWRTGKRLLPKGGNLPKSST